MAKYKDGDKFLLIVDGSKIREINDETVYGFKSFSGFMTDAHLDKIKHLALTEDTINKESWNKGFNSARKIINLSQKDIRRLFGNEFNNGSDVIRFCDTENIYNIYHNDCFTSDNFHIGDMVFYDEHDFNITAIDGDFLYGINMETGITYGCRKSDCCRTNSHSGVIRTLFGKGE